MKAQRVVLPLLVAVVSALQASTASAGFINGNFQTGNLTGWTASAIDRNGNPTTPLISVSTVGGNSFAVFDTGRFATGTLVSTLQQSFTVNAAESILSIDFTRLLVVPDPTGTGTSPFLDSFVVSLANGTKTFTLALADRNRVLLDPFGTSLPVTLGVPVDRPSTSRSLRTCRPRPVRSSPSFWT